MKVRPEEVAAMAAAAATQLPASSPQRAKYLAIVSEMAANRHAHTTQVTIHLPGPPRGKGRPRFRLMHKGAQVFGKTYTDEKTRSYETLLREAAQAVMGDRPLLDGALHLVMEARMAVPASWSKKKQAAALAGGVHPTGKPDLDNLVKVLDALNGVVWRDDSLIVSADVRKSYSDRPGLTITVGKMEG
jgi:Holliday junction resolvase RusA-like endonuclease